MVVLDPFTVEPCMAIKGLVADTHTLPEPTRPTRGNRTATYPELTTPSSRQFLQDTSQRSKSVQSPFKVRSKSVQSPFRPHYTSFFPLDIAMVHSARLGYGSGARLLYGSSARLVYCSGARLVYELKCKVSCEFWCKVRLRFRCTISL